MLVRKRHLNRRMEDVSEQNSTGFGREEMEGTVVLSCDRDHRGDEQRREWGVGRQVKSVPQQSPWALARLQPWL